MRLLKQEKGIFKLFLLNVDQGALVELEQHHGDLIFTHLELLIVVLVERVVYTKSTVCLRGTVATSFATCGFYSINGVPNFTTSMTLNTKALNRKLSTYMSD